MGEDIDTKNTPNFIPTDAEIDEMMRPFVDPLLTEAEIDALMNSEDRGILKPVPQHKPASLEEFKTWQNNFWTAFDLTNDFGAIGTRRSKAFQRFVLLNPQLAARVFDEMTAYTSQPEDARRRGFSEELWKGLYDAYMGLADLVDESDRYAVRPNGEPDPYLLKR